MNWPRGKYNGRRIGGFALRFEFNLTFWYWSVIWRSYSKSIHGNAGRSPAS